MADGRARGFFSRFRRRTWALIGVAVLLIAAVAVVSVYRLSPSAQADAEEAQTQSVAASLETLQKSVEASGTLTPAVQEDVSFIASGTVTAVEVQAGDTVSEGDVLASVDTLTMNAQLLQAVADLADAESQLASAEESADGSTASDAQIAAREAAVTVAQQQVDAAQEAMDGTTLVAPVSGLVTSVSIDVGDAVTGSGSTSSAGGSDGAAEPGGMSTTTASSSGSGSSQFTIVGTEAWTVSVSLSETDIGVIETGNQVELSTTSGTQLFGIVEEVGILASTTSGTPTFPVTIAITSDPSGLFDGTSVTASIIYERRVDVLTIPSAAVTTAEDGSTTVTVVDDAGAQTVTTVTLGETSGDVVEVLEGLEEGQMVVVAVFTPTSDGDQQDDTQLPGGGSFPGGDGSVPGGEGFPGGDGSVPGGGQFPGGGGTQ